MDGRIDNVYLSSICPKCFIPTQHKKEDDSVNGGFSEFYCITCSQLSTNWYASNSRRTKIMRCNLCDYTCARNTQIIDHLRDVHRVGDAVSSPNNESIDFEPSNNLHEDLEMADADDCGKADEKVSSDSKQCEEEESNMEHVFDCAYKLVNPSGDNNDDPQCEIVDSFCRNNHQADQVLLEQFKYKEYCCSSFTDTNKYTLTILST